MEVPTNVPITSLESIIQEAGGPVKLLRGNNIGPYTFPVIPPEFTNWRDEVWAWKDSLALLELSYHMTERKDVARCARYIEAFWMRSFSPLLSASESIRMEVSS